MPAQGWSAFGGKKSLLITAIVLVAISTSGCIKFKTANDTSDINGGVFKTVNMGNTWMQKTLIPTTSGKAKSFSGVNVASFTIDPSDRGALYFGSVGNGLFYTYDGAENWRIAEGLGRATIRSVVVDPNSKCVIYVAVGNKVYKSTDCNRTWSQVYYDNDTRATVDAIAIDHYNSNNVYITISRGDIVKSVNGGSEWATIYRIKNKITDLVIDPNDSRNIFAVTSEKGVYKTSDSGASWASMEKLLDAVKSEKIGFSISSFVVIRGEAGVMFMATKLGMLRTFDGGETWERINVIPTEKKAVINALAVNHKNYNEIFYITNTTFYRSLDGGESWATKNLPTSRNGWGIILDPEDPNIIYITVFKVEK